MFGGALKVRSTHRLFRFWMGLDGCECCKPHSMPIHLWIQFHIWVPLYVAVLTQTNNKTASATMAWKQGGATDPSYPSIFKIFTAEWWCVEPFAHCSDQRLGPDSDMPSPAKVFTYPQGGIWVAIPPKPLGRNADCSMLLHAFAGAMCGKIFDV